MEDKTIKVAILGLGTIGSSTYNNIYKNQEAIFNKTEIKLEVTKVLEKDPSLFKDKVKNNCLVTSNYNEILEDEEISIIIELMGGTTFAFDCVLKALKKGKHVVTANKALIAEHIEELNDAVNNSTASFFYEAAVAGGIPVIEAVKRSFNSNNIKNIQSIVNGTCNYILTEMAEKGLEFNEVLKTAQEKGYAEADPTFDIEGIDTAHKISILTGLAFGRLVKFNDIKNVEGITRVNIFDINMARELGCCIKLIASTQETESGIDVRVGPCLVNKHHPLASVEGVYNAVFIEGDLVGKTMFYGKGAGGDATSSAVISDVINCAIDSVVNRNKRFTFYKDMESNAKVSEFGSAAKFYVRLLVKDSPGVLATIAGIFAENNISIATVSQKNSNNEFVPVFLTTHQASEEDMRKSRDEIMKVQKEAKLKEAPFIMKIIE